MVVAYFDRLVRSLQVQREVVERVERAGGAIIALDVGEVRADTASRWLSSTMLGMVAEYARRVTAERTADAKRRAVERGVPPFPNIPPGYRQGKDGRLEPHPKQARAVADAFRLRAEGATVMEVREFLRKRGIERSFHGTQSLLTSRVVLGELRFGDLVNTKSHPAIVDAQTWRKVQKMRSPRGPRAKSERLLARLGILRCGTCGARMVVGSTDQNGKRHYMYRCPPIADCPRRVTISAELAERVVVEKVKELLEGKRGTATIEDNLADTRHAMDQAAEKRDNLIRTLEGLEHVEAAREQIVAANDEYERAAERYEELLAAATPALTVSSSRAVDASAPDELRALIRSLVDRAVVVPGRGADRITVHALGQ